MHLNETLVSVKEFHTKDRMSEAKTYLAQLDDLKDKVQGFLEEVLTTETLRSRFGHFTANDKLRFVVARGCHVCCLSSTCF